MYITSHGHVHDCVCAYQYMYMYMYNVHDSRVAIADE